MASKVDALHNLATQLGASSTSSTTIAGAVHEVTTALGATASEYNDESSIARSIQDIADAIEDGAISIGGGEVKVVTLTVSRGSTDYSFDLGGFAFLREYDGSDYIDMNGWGSSTNMGSALTADVRVIAHSETGAFVEPDIPAGSTVTTSGAIEYDEEEGYYIITGDASITFSSDK